MCCCDWLPGDQNQIPTRGQVREHFMYDRAHLAFGAVSLYRSADALSRHKSGPEDLQIIFRQN